MLKKLLQILFPVILLTVTIPVMAQHTLPDKVCVGKQRTYKVTGLPNSVFTWKIDGVVQASTEDHIDITWTESGVYTIELQEHQLNCSSDVKSGTVTVLPIPYLPASKGDIIALAENPVQTLDANNSVEPVSGITIIWYEEAVGGTAVDLPTLNHIGTKTYYAEADNGICTSAARTPVVLTLLPENVIPTVTALSTNDNTPLITGTVTVNAGDDFKVIVNGVTYTLGDGNLSLIGSVWYLQIPTGNELADSTYPVTATVTNIINNSSTDATTNELVIDTTAPAAPTVNTKNTNDNTPLITGTVTVNAGDDFKVIVNGVTYTLGDGNLSIVGNIWSLQIPVGNELADGTYSVTATVTDSFGNAATDASANELEVDHTAPAIPTVDVLKTNDPTPMITGTANIGVGDILKVAVKGVTYISGDGNLRITGNNWSLQIPAANSFADGIYSVTATLTDSFGNISMDVTDNELEIDITAPPAPTVNVLRTNDSTPVITGTVTLNATDDFKVIVNGELYVIGDGNLTILGNVWSLQIPAGSELADGTYSVKATVTDSFGNTASDVTNQELEVDTTAPDVPTVNLLKTNDATPVITGTATVGPDDEFKVTVNGTTYTLGDGNLTLNGNNWSLQIPAGNELSDGIYWVTAKVTDSLGNSSIDNTSDELVIDTTAPDVPTVTRLSTNDSTPIITGTAKVYMDDVFKVTLNGVTYRLGDGNLSIIGNNWSLQVPAIYALTDGIYSVTATITDSFGNIANDATSNELEIDTTAPEVPTVVSLSTNDSTPIITGTATVDTDDLFKVTLNGVTYTYEVDLNLTLIGNAWSLQVLAINALADGTYPVTATITDSFGNIATDATSNELEVDITAPDVPTVASLSTNDSTPIITGTATVDTDDLFKVILNGITYTLGDGNLSILGNNWSLQIPAANALADGTYSVAATVTDSFGNTATDATDNELVIDTTAPAIPTVDILKTNNSTPLITGTATLGASDLFKVTINGVTYTPGDGNLSIAGNNWSLQIPAVNALADGIYSVSATVSDSFGNTVTDATNNELEVDTTAPEVPTVASLSTNDSTPLITGTATVSTGDVLTVIVNGITYTLGDGNLSMVGNNWSLQIPAVNALADGTYSVTAIIADALGNAATDVTVNELEIDTTAPEVPTVARLSTNASTPIITGTATISAGDMFKVTVNGITYTLGDGNLSMVGNNWSLQIPTANALADGTYSVTAIIADALGNTATDVTVNELEIDTTAPEVPTVASLSTNDNTPIITGTATVMAGDVFTVTVNGVIYTLGDGNLTLNGNNWSLQIPAANVLADGIYSVTATVSDFFGNTATDATNNELEVDTTAPEVPTVARLSTNDSTPLITGTATVSSGDVLKVIVNGITYTLGEGNLSMVGKNWSLQIPAANALADGIYSVSATVSDSFGNTATDATNNELEVDTTAPEVPTVARLSTNDSTPLITGTATVSTGDVLKVIVNGITYTLGEGNLSMVGNNWSLQIPAVNALADGTYSVTAIIADALGNAATDVTVNELEIDTTAPEVPTVASLSTNDSTPIITGTATVGTNDLLKVKVNGVIYTLGDGNLSITGHNWSLQIPAGSEIADGTYSVTAIVSDALGNSSADITASELEIDTTAPEAPTVARLSTNDSTPIITGTASIINAGDELKVTVNGITYTLGDGNLSLTGHNWSLQIPAGSEIADGTYSVAATVTDSFGNAATDATNNELVIDTTAPAIPSIDLLKTNDPSPVITGTATVAAGDVFEVTVNGVIYTPGDGNLTLIGNVWSLQIPAANKLTDGTYSVAAAVTDSFGNRSTDLLSNELVIDVTAPVAPTVAILKTNDSTPAITGTAIIGAGEVFEVRVNGIAYTLEDGNLSLDGNNWNLQIPAANALADGAYSVTATVTDSFGNAATDATVNELEIDATAPAIPTVASLSTNDPTPNISGTVTMGAEDDFKVTVNNNTYWLGDGNLSLAGTLWSLQIPAGSELPDGTYSVTATVTDSFGNSSQDKTMDELTIKTHTAPVARILNSPSIVLGTCSSGVQLDGSASSGNGLVYLWTPSNYLDNPSSSKPNFHPGSTTRYLLTVTDDKGISDTTSVLVRVAEAPKAITDKNVYVETPEIGVVLNGSQSKGVNLSYVWSTKEGHIITGENQPSVTVNGLGTYYLVVNDSFGCTSRDSVSVGLYFQAVNDTAAVTVNQSVVINVLRNDLPRGAVDPSSITIVTPPSHGIATLEADSLINYQPETSYTGPDEFVYTVCDHTGICDHARVLVLVNDTPFFIPEAFSPNGDGINDRFVIKGLEKYKRVEIEIFNRWGNIVYQSHNYGEGEGKNGYWDGTASTGLRIESGPVPSGTYYYILKINGQKNISGAIYLDR